MGSLQTDRFEGGACGHAVLVLQRNTTEVLLVSDDRDAAAGAQE